MKTLALIPLRGGSKSIPKKNIKEIAGKPLCAWVLEAATHAQHIDTVYVSTDSVEIETVVHSLNLNVKVIQRPKELATDEASTESVMLHFIEQIACDCLVTIQATSPVLLSKHLDNALQQFESQNLDSMLSAVRSKRFFWNDNGIPLNYNPLKRPRRQEFTGTLMENGAFYITRCSILEKYKCRLGGKIGIYEMPENSAVEIDELDDWEIVARLLQHY
ncbi:MAG: acylneuraminate cytidylyltransferase family protein [Cyanobacteria bacterium J06592_8]